MIHDDWQEGLQKATYIACCCNTFFIRRKKEWQPFEWRSQGRKHLRVYIYNCKSSWRVSAAAAAAFDVNYVGKTKTKGENIAYPFFLRVVHHLSKWFILLIFPDFSSPIVAHENLVAVQGVRISLKTSWKRFLRFPEQSGRCMLKNMLQQHAPYGLHW